MSEFNYVGQGLYHTSDQSNQQEQESLYSLLQLLKSQISLGDLSGYKITQAKISLSLLQTQQQRTHFILSQLLSKITVNNELTAMVYQLISEAMVSNELGKAIDLTYILSQCTLINVDVSSESYLVNNYMLVNLPIGSSYNELHLLTSSIMNMSVGSGFSVSGSYLKTIDFGAQIADASNGAKSNLMDIVSLMQQGNNYSLDYILAQLKLLADEALAKLRNMNQFFINAHLIDLDIPIGNFLSYGKINSNLSETEMFSNLGSIQEINSKLLSEIYSASDAKFPEGTSRLAISETLADIKLSTDSTVLLLNTEFNQANFNRSSDVMNSIITSVDNLNSNVNSNSINQNTAVAVDSLTRTITDSNINGLAKNIAGSSIGVQKANKKVPFDVGIVGVLSGYLGKFKDKLGWLTDLFNSKFFGGLGSFFSNLQSLMDKLTAGLQKLLGPILGSITALIAKLALIIAAINLFLCGLKALLCLIGSVLNTLKKAIALAQEYYKKFQSYLSMLNKNSFGLSNFNSLNLQKLKDRFTNDLTKPFMETLRDGVMAKKGDILAALTAAGVPTDKLTQVQNLFSNSSDSCSGSSSILSSATNAASSFISSKVNDAYNGIANMVKEGMNCPAISMPSIGSGSLGSFTLPKFNLNLTLPSLNLKIGC